MPNSLPPHPDRLWTHTLNLHFLQVALHLGSKQGQQWIWGLEFHLGVPSPSSRSLYLIWRRRPLHTDPARLLIWSQARLLRMTHILRVSRWHYQDAK